MTCSVRTWLCVVLLAGVGSALYEDQIGKFDWTQKFIGKIKYSHLDATSPIKKIIVATEENVLGCLSLKTGELIWRQVLDKEQHGTIQYLNVDTGVVTVTGQSPYLVREWNIENGNLLSEWAPVPTAPEDTKWLVIGPNIIQINLISTDRVELTVYNLNSGAQITFIKIPAPWLIPENCVLSERYLVCVTDDKKLYSVRISDNNNQVKVQHKPLLDLMKSEAKGVLKEVKGSLPQVAFLAGDVQVIIKLSPEIEVVEMLESKHDAVTVTVEDQNILFAAYLENQVYNVIAKNLDNNEMIAALSNKFALSKSVGKPSISSMVCQQRRDKVIACRLLLTGSDHSLTLVQHPGTILWTREEALSSIVTVEMIDLPMSDTDAAIEKEFNLKESNVLSMFLRRVSSQIIQLQSLILTVLGLINPQPSTQKDGLVKDEFGLHKLIIVATASGKLFGIDNFNGNIIWSALLEDIESFNERNQLKYPLFVLRTTRHNPLPAQCALLGKHKSSGDGVLFVFNPITGETIETINLGYKVKQVTPLHQLDENFIKGLLLLSQSNKVDVYPKSSTKVALSSARTTFLYVADSTTGLIDGYSLSYSTETELVASKIWNVNVGHNSETIIALVGKNLNEKVHSQGRVMGDRSVLYKYVNPNLVAVVTLGSHPSHKSVISVYLLDVVSGNIVFSIVHKRAKEPFHIVHSENWLLYTFFSDKYRRTELTSLELYEGKTQSNASIFSSIDSASFLPIVERQSYILPSNVLTLKETITEKGITSKHILVALSSGGILELPWIYIDPRRPVTVTQEMREEGVIPYMPELPVPLEAIINYNQSLANVRGIFTSPSDLESTCLVFTYGLDIFYTRVSPSKTFDLLKDDFDYFFISTVLTALTVASYVSRRLSSRKALKQAWK